MIQTQRSNTSTTAQAAGTTEPGARKEEKESFFEKFGTLGKKKKQTSPSGPQRLGPNGEPLEVEEDEAARVDAEGREAIDSSLVPDLVRVRPLEEGEERRYLTHESADDPRLLEIIKLLLRWLNDELNPLRIVVKHIQEDLYDGHVLQKLVEKLAGVKIDVPEVTLSEGGQLEKLATVLGTCNQVLATGGPGGHQQPAWTTEQIHHKDITAIMQLLIALALHFRAPVRFPEFVAIQILVVSRRGGKTERRTITEQLTTQQLELGQRGKRDAFDTLFDHGPEKLASVKQALLAFCNKHLNKINLEVVDLETQFQDGVFLVLLMGLLEGYFVPLHAFNLQVNNYDEKVKNVAFAYRLIEDAGLETPRSRVEDIANGDLKSTIRLLHQLFSKYKHV